MLSDCLTPYAAFLKNLSQKEIQLSHGRENRQQSVFFNPFSANNPVVVQVLEHLFGARGHRKTRAGAGDGNVGDSGAGVLNVIISLIRNTIPTNIRIIVQLVVVAGLVVIVDQLLQALRLRCQQAAVGVYRSDHHQLHPHGTARRSPWPTARGLRCSTA